MKVSIVTAVYNRVATVGEMIESIRTQTHADIEHLVIDGKSSDGTLDVVEKYRDSIAVLVSEPDAGIYDALNKGLRLASGDIVGFLHADDVLATEHAIARIAHAFADPTVDAVYGDLEYVSNKDTRRVLRYWRAGACDQKKLSRGWMPPHPTFYTRKSTYERLGYFDTSYRIAADYDSLLRFLIKGRLKTVYIPEVLVRMRVGGASNSVANLVRKTREDYRILRAHNLFAMRALAWKNISKLPQFITRTA
jgi:glycosyltransferase involved in cell wall biosynthesis